MASSAVPIPGATSAPGTPRGSLDGATPPDDAARSLYRILLVDDDPATLMAMKHHLVRMRGPVQYQGARRRCWQCCEVR